MMIGLFSPLIERVDLSELRLTTRMCRTQTPCFAEDIKPNEQSEKPAPGWKKVEEREALFILAVALSGWNNERSNVDISKTWEESKPLRTVSAAYVDSLVHSDRVFMAQAAKPSALGPPDACRMEQLYQTLRLNEAPYPADLIQFTALIPSLSRIPNDCPIPNFGLTKCLAVHVV